MECKIFPVLKKDFSPGPAHFIDPTITYRGRDGTPHYSLYSRHKDFGKLWLAAIYVYAHGYTGQYHILARLICE